MAYVVGVMLLVLVCVAMPIHYLGHDRRVSDVVSPIHGFLYIVYLLAALDLAMKARWNFWTTVGLLLSGAVPFLSFYMERRVTKQVQERFLQPAGAGSTASAG
jgi:integral membrane protein